MSPVMQPRVLIVDDHPLTREALATLLAGNDFDVVGQASDGQEAIELAGGSGPRSSCSTSRCRGWTGSRPCPASGPRCLTPR